MEFHQTRRNSDFATARSPGAGERLRRAKQSPRLRRLQHKDRKKLCTCNDDIVTPTPCLNIAQRTPSR